MSRISTPTSSEVAFLGEINEILLGLYCGGGSFSAFGDKSSFVRGKLDELFDRVSSEFYSYEHGRAKIMAEKVLSWARSNGFDGSVEGVWWTGRDQKQLYAAVGRTLDPVATNPTDILIKFSGGRFLGVSAKSKGGESRYSQKITFKSVRLNNLSRTLGLDLGDYKDDEVFLSIEELDLPKIQKRRKEFLREVEHKNIQMAITNRTERLFQKIRDSMLVRMRSMPNQDLVDHLVNYWLRVNLKDPYYIIVIGSGSESNYVARIIDPSTDAKLKSLQCSDIEMMKIGAGTIGIQAGDVRILQIRLKWDSEPMASGIKVFAEGWD